MQLCGDVDFLPGQVGQGVLGQAPAGIAFAARTQLGHVGIAGGDALCQFNGFALVQCQLVAVVEAQQPAPTVADRMTVVLS